MRTETQLATFLYTNFFLDILHIYMTIYGHIVASIFQFFGHPVYVMITYGFIVASIDVLFLDLDVLVLFPYSILWFN